MRISDCELREDESKPGSHPPSNPPHTAMLSACADDGVVAAAVEAHVAVLGREHERARPLHPCVLRGGRGEYSSAAHVEDVQAAVAREAEAVRARREHPPADRDGRVRDEEAL